MQITSELPDDIANQLQLQPANISRRILELIAADNYRQGGKSFRPIIQKPD